MMNSPICSKCFERGSLCKECELKTNWVVRGLTRKCPKGMEYDKCPYNPRLGCNCGVNKPTIKITSKLINTIDLTRRPGPFKEKK